MTFRPACSPRLRRSIASIALFALVLAQTLGMLHGVVHSPLALADGAAAGSLGATPPKTTAGESAASALKDLFAGHGGERACHLYDHSSHADLLGVDVLDASPPAFDPAPACAPAAPHRAAPLVAFLARGPPA